MTLTLLTEHQLEFLNLKGGCTGSSESTHVKISHCWKSQAAAHSQSKHMIGLWLFSLSFLSLLSVSEPQPQATTPILCSFYGYLAYQTYVTSLFQSRSRKTLHQYVGLCLDLWLFTSLSISEPAARHYTNMLACTLVYGYLPLSLFQSQQQDTTPICWLVPWSMVIYLSLYFRASSKTLHQYVGLCPDLWLFTSLSISEPAARNYTNMLACALVYGYLPLSISEPAARNYTNMLACALIYGYLPLSPFLSQQQDTTPICWLVPWSMVIYLSLHF